MPQEYPVDDQAEDINREPKTNIVDINVNVSDWILKLPDSQLDVS